MEFKEIVNKARKVQKMYANLEKSFLKTMEGLEERIKL